MDIGIGLPNSIPGTDGATLLSWARQAEEGGFATLSTIDRLVYDSYEPLIALAAAAAVTERIKLMTGMLLGPLRTNTALLAKQAAGVDRLSGGRLVLGLTAGARPDDFAASEVPTRGRGRRLAIQVEALRSAWNGVGGGTGGGGSTPVQPGGPPVILGGHAPAAIDRAARVGDGWMAGGAGPTAFGHGAKAFTEAWRRHGRTGRPRLLSLAYFALGGDAEDRARAYLGAYYASAGPFAGMAIQQAATGERGVADLVAAFEEQGCDEVIFMPCSPDPGDLHRLSRIVSTL